MSTRRFVSACVVIFAVTATAFAAELQFRAEQFAARKGDFMVVLHPPFESHDVTHGTAPVALLTNGRFTISEAIDDAFLGVPGLEPATWTAGEDTDFVRYSVSVPESGDWYFWVRSIAPSQGDNSYYWAFDIDAAEAVSADTATMNILDHEISNCALIGGECAEMPDIYQEGDFDIAGFAVGVVELDRAIDPSRVEAGDIIIGLPSSGVHSNGFTLVRAAVADLELRTVYPELDSKRTLGEVLLEPTRIYVEPIVKLLRQYRVKKVVSGMAHITGGGIAGNLCRSICDRVDATVHLNRWNVPSIFSFLQQHGNIEIEEMFRVFNMGIGYILIVRPSFADSILAHLQQLGELPILLGEITGGSGKVHLISGE